MMTDRQDLAYAQIYDDTRLMILVLGGLSDAVLADAAIELQVDYEVWCMDYSGPALPDAHVGFAEMLRQWPTPWEADKDSGLNGLTVAQFFFAWAWSQNDTARYCLDGHATTQEWKPWEPAAAAKAGVNAAISAAKSLAHARLLMATAPKAVAQEG